MSLTLESLVATDFGIGYNGRRFLKSKQHDSLVVDKETQRFYWNSKRMSGGIKEYLRVVRGFDGPIDDVVECPPMLILDIPDTTVDSELVMSFFNEGKDNRDYWKDYRGYTDETIDSFRLGFHDGWYTIPIYVNGEFQNFQLRRNLPKKLVSYWYKGKGVLPFNFSVLRNVDRIFITEGPPDAILLSQYGIPAVSQTGGSGYWNVDWNKYFVGLKHIFIVYDNDEAGEKGAENLVKNFGNKASFFTYTGFPPKTDTTDFLKDHTGNDFIRLVIENARKY